MKIKKPNAELLWKQIEDLVVPRLSLSAVDRVVYWHLLRHSHLEGKARLCFSIPWLARGVRFSGDTARQAVRRLIEQGALSLLERSKTGHVVLVRLPEEIPAVRSRSEEPKRVRLPRAASLEETDFLQTRTLRGAIHERERGCCFYCLRQVPVRVRCLDHVVPRVRSGSNSYRNLVSCCQQCNALKGERDAEDFLRWLYRGRRLTEEELVARLRALDELAAGKLRPALQSQGDTGSTGKEVASDECRDKYSHGMIAENHGGKK
jgi:5-methylcytosine-specific restriction endonuclease McrA